MDKQNVRRHPNIFFNDVLPKSIDNGDRPADPFCQRILLIGRLVPDSLYGISEEDGNSDPRKFISPNKRLMIKALYFGASCVGILMRDIE